MKFFPILLMIIMWVSTPQPMSEQRSAFTFLSKVYPEFALIIDQLRHISMRTPQMKDNAAFGK